MQVREVFRRPGDKRRDGMYHLWISVEEVKGFCDLPMKPGDYFEVDGGRLIVPPGKHVCIWALQSMIPFLAVKQRKLVEENDWISTTSRLSCPDPNGMVVYKVDIVGETGEPVSWKPDGDAGAVVAPDAGIPPRMLVDQDACSGCRRCELGCSFFHEGRYWPEMSRVRVDKDESRGLDSPVVCRQCGSARCVQACPEHALSRDPRTRAIVLDKERCLKCYACRDACPFGAIHLDTGKIPLICDLCGGDPACVKACPTAAVRFGRAGDGPAKARFVQPGKERPGRTSRGEGGPAE